jgi:UPF0755 protein
MRRLLRSFFLLFFLLLCASVAGLMGWSYMPITDKSSLPIDFTVNAGGGVHKVMQQITEEGVPISPTLIEVVARLTNKAGSLKAGSYTLKPGTTPLRLIDQLVRGEFAQESLIVIEGWTFGMMRRAIADHPALKHETANWTESELLKKITPDFKEGEGLFFPDTYRFAKGASDLQIYRQAYLIMQKKLQASWSTRMASLPYKTPYEALIMASIVEKETGVRAERGQIASVFVNRLQLGMPLQTDPTVIYGMGESYKGQIRKRDLTTDTRFNTYIRAGLPPTPISLPGAASLDAALHPTEGNALYFVSRGDGTSKFSDNLKDHNRAVNAFQR